MMDLNRHLAPMSERVWKRVDETAREVLELHLAARRLVEFDGPHGWEHSAIDLGSVEPIEAPSQGVLLYRRVVRPLVELCVPFALERDELERIERGSASVNLDPLRDAARTLAGTEDTALFEGCPPADIPGLLTHSSNPAVPLARDALRIPDALTRAMEHLRQAGVAGPYAVALGPEPYAALVSSAGDGGYPVLRHVERLLDRPVIWAPTLRGGIVVSLRGGDFKLVCGRDIAIGYSSHDDKRVQLYMEESFSAELSGPEAVVALLPDGE
jgi:uncharacterized linocin/CFP29 family protein